MKTLHSFGNREVAEYEIEDAVCPDNGILVKTKLVGICRSDAAQFAGLEKGVPLGQFGHEGLGEVIDIGPNFKSDRSEEIELGDLVATWSDPAYAEFYPAKPNEFVKVPEIAPEYILQPAACATNIYRQTKKFMERMGLNREDILLLGSGFMAVIIGEICKAENQNLIVVGRANSEIWQDIVEVKYDTVDDLLATDPGKFSVIIDISSKAENFHKITSDLAAHEALIVYAGTPTEPVTTNFFENCWQCQTIIMPSPRNSDFNDAMAMTRDLITEGKLNTKRLWTKGYNRETEFEKAFIDAADRPEGYIRGFLKY